VLVLKPFGASRRFTEYEIIVVWSWHPLLMLTLAEVLAAQPGTRSHSIREATVAKRNSSPESAKETVPTIAWGMPDDSGASAVNTGVHTHYPQRARGCGCIGHPAFPAPSVFKGREIFWKASGESAPRERECMSRHCEERLRRSNPAFDFAARWIASLTLAMMIPTSACCCLKFESVEFARAAPHFQLSSPGMTGRPSTPGHQRLSRKTAAYWMPRFRGA
jgi:hypothetical protein